MPRLVLTPFNQNGEAVKRGVVSLRAGADRAAIAAKVAYCSKRADLGVIVHVEVTDKDGFFVSAWDVRAGAVVQTDGRGSETFESARIPADTGITEMKMTETTAQETAEAKAAAKEAKAAAKAKDTKPKEPTKKDRVLELLKSKHGTTLEEIVAKLGVTQPAARALIGDCQRISGVTIKRLKDDKGVSTYSA